MSSFSWRKAWLVVWNTAVHGSRAGNHLPASSANSPLPHFHAAVATSLVLQRSHPDAAYAGSVTALLAVTPWQDLHLKALSKTIKMQEHLLERGASPDSPETPLMGAAFTKRKRRFAQCRSPVLTGMLFCSIIFVFYILYAYTVGQPIPYSKRPRTPLVVRVPDYGTFKGTQVLRHLHRNKALDEPVDAWLGIEYARQPVGQYRFAPPGWPEPFNGTKDASEYGPICIQSGSGMPQSEACLNFNLFRTAGVPYSKRLPVLVFLHGGAFVVGHGRNFDGAVFVSRSSEPIMVVTAQYRLNALGSLPSKLFEEEGLLNLGILDQQLLLKFLQKYISIWGGDPDRITLSGQSAGAHSVGIHLFHNYGEDAGKPLFSQAILSSGSPTARAFPEATYPLYKRQFDDFMTYLKCPQSPNAAALECLRTVDIEKIRTKATQMYYASNYNITWPFQPVSPGPLLEKRGSTSGEDETFWKVPTIISSTTDEGSFFAPRNLQTNKQFTSFLENVNPGLTQQDLKDLETLYPSPKTPDSPYANSTKSKQFKRITAAYGDYSYICPVQDAAYRLAKAGVPVYKARWNTPNGGEEWQGVPHASDALYFNGIPNVQFPEISEMYSSYWASFVVSGDPNKYAVEGAPTWELYKGVGGKALKVGSRNGTDTRMEDEGEGIRMEACAWWRDPERMKRLKK